MKKLFLLLLLTGCHFFNSSSENTEQKDTNKKSFKQTAKPNVDNEFAMEHERVLNSWLTDLDTIQDLGFKYKATFRILDYINNYPTLPLEIKNTALIKIQPNLDLFGKLQKFVEKMSVTDINYIFQENDMSLLKQLGSLPFPHFQNKSCDFDQLIPVLKDEKYLSHVYKSWSDIQNFLKAHDQYYLHNYFASIKTLLKTNKISTEQNAKEFDALITSFLTLYFGSAEEDFKEKTKSLIKQRANALAKKGLDTNPLSYHKTLVSCAWSDVQTMRNQFAKVITWYRMQWIAARIKHRITGNPQLLKKIESPQDLIRYLKLDKSSIIQESNLDGWRNDFKLTLTEIEIELKSNGPIVEYAGDDLVFKLSL
jgi:hypothetical protein